eukprot:CAMPEP_0194196114 /NCGR_PEP_ID=MMETSP0154-20130528/76495_1 /TAXON_ID=1049557 /ORGANISM="Thalassiothrix antarctica, Strain L6-D1" /LENGTH=873 /DNA_ID=CAMNT_0038920691 /DNA_START=133 /DNA_END=2755 /DNA_ORIENTATION=-
MFFFEDLVNSLDLLPLIYGVSNHAGTRRGRQALLSLVGENTEHQQDFLKVSSRDISRRKRVSKDFSSSNKQHNRHSDLIKVSSSVEEAQDEYELVRQASLAIDETTSNKDLTYPPLYGAKSSPDDIMENIDTDYDEWLWLDTDQLNLEHVLHAEQVILTLIRVREWATLKVVSASLPKLSAIGAKILHDELSTSLKQIGESVEIVRVNQGSVSSYIFQLRDEKFPDIIELRLKAKELVDKIDQQMKPLRKKTKGSPECVDYNGRRVLLVPKSQATASFGVIRGKEGGSNTLGRYYVEPRSIIQYGDELVLVREKLKAAEVSMKKKLIESIVGVRPIVDISLQYMARLDVIFSKAVFSKRFNGVIPKLNRLGKISIENFVHPVLALTDAGSVVATDLHLADNLVAAKSLIISGPNGGGKSVSMKSFGLACLMAKMAIPIPQKTGNTPNIGFFDHVFVEHGYQQDMLEGESTFMAKLNACSSLIQSLQDGKQDSFSLILLDELGSGTDPVAGGAVGQAIMEKILENKLSCIVATTHSAQLKALSFNNEQFACATMLSKPEAASEFKLPTYQLKYGLIGGSYALDAVSRADPPFSDDVIVRVGNLISSAVNEKDGKSDSDGKLLKALTNSLEKQTQEVIIASEEVNKIKLQVVDFRDALISLSNAYMKRYNDVEKRLKFMVELLKDDDAKNLQIMGDTIDNLRLLRKKIKSKTEKLKERGLKPISDLHKFTAGENVVIVSDGPLDGTSATIVEQHDTERVTVELEADCTWDENTATKTHDERNTNLKLLSRRDLAVWDYDSIWDDMPYAEEVSIPNLQESKNRLQTALSKISASLNTEGHKATKLENKKSSQFTSSYDRKANKKKGKNKKKKKKKK